MSQESTMTNRRTHYCDVSKITVYEMAVDFDEISEWLKLNNYENEGNLAMDFSYHFTRCDTCLLYRLCNQTD